MIEHVRDKGLGAGFACRVLGLRGVAAGRADDAEGAVDDRGVGAPHRPAALGVQQHHAHAVCKDVVDLAGDARPLLGDGDGDPGRGETLRLGQCGPSLELGDIGAPGSDSQPD
ncbi:hypothetical protein GCM10010276_11620 [Streptomyces longisporus]|uniref:Uncharacterized protein n=1 Tax=Streptomyces longisporus TaxID=1948 RepID=A0ABP5YD50_STRLO